MRKTLITAFVALALGAVSAEAAEFGIGAYGGASIPILNDLSKSGATFGVRVPVKLSTLVIVEPFYQDASLGDVSDNFGTSVSYSRDGGQTTGFGVNALLTFGESTFRFYPFAGIGSYTIKRDGADDVTDVGYNFGLGLSYAAMPKLNIDLRGEFNMIATDETSQKFGNITLGVSYALFSFPAEGGAK